MTARVAQWLLRRYGKARALRIAQAAQVLGALLIVVSVFALFIGALVRARGLA